MSYILEALKKAQAERQLGALPTIHAPTLHAIDQAAPGGRMKKPLLLALLAMAAVIVVLLVLVLRRSPAEAPQTMPSAPAAAIAQAAPAPVVAPAPVAIAAPVAVVASTPVVAPAPPLPVVPKPIVTPPALPAASPAKAVAAAPAEEQVPNLRDLPEPIQRSIPQIAVGGYIYSKNASDRLLLIDKVLRHEGEEVAPGLVLEKLQPKEAVFNFKGYRYRLPY